MDGHSSQVATPYTVGRRERFAVLGITFLLLHRQDWQSNEIGRSVILLCEQYKFTIALTDVDQTW